MRIPEAKREAREKLMRAMLFEIDTMATDSPDDRRMRDALVEDFTRIEKFLGFRVGEWSNALA